MNVWWVLFLCWLCFFLGFGTAALMAANRSAPSDDWSDD